MEKFNRATKDFLHTLSDGVEKDLKGAKKEINTVKKKGLDEKSFRDAVRVAKLVSRIENIPRAFMAYGLTKNATQMTEDIDAIRLYNYLMENYETDWIAWTPETIRKTILDNIPNDIIENKVQALAVCLSTDTPWIEWHIFENVGKAFNHQVPNFGSVQPLSVGECEVAMKTMNYMRDEDFSYEVLVYVGARAANENYVYLPEEFYISDAQNHLDSFTYDKWLRDKVKQMWSSLKNSDRLIDVEVSETPEEIQLGKLIVLQQYVKEHTEE